VFAVQRYSFAEKDFLALEDCKQRMEDKPGKKLDKPARSGLTIFLQRKNNQNSKLSRMWNLS